MADHRYFSVLVEIIDHQALHAKRSQQIETKYNIKCIFQKLRFRFKFYLPLTGLQEPRYQQTNRPPVCPRCVDEFSSWTGHQIKDARDEKNVRCCLWGGLSSIKLLTSADVST
jgi:hypothetical protein